MKKSLIITLSLALTLMSLQAAPTRKKTSLNQQALAERVIEALDQYNLTLAEELLDEWDSSISRSRQTAIPLYEQLVTRHLSMTNMLERVEAVTIISADTLDSRAFDSSSLPINIDIEAGALYGPQWFINRTDIVHDSLSTAHIPAGSREIFWTGPDKNGGRTLYEAGFLLDGSLDNPRQVFQGQENVGFIDMTTPFLADDGLTLYFSAKNDNSSLGGYDIYRSVRSGAGAQFSTPTNIGMPYNSPADDYMYCIDPTTGLAQFTSERSEDNLPVTYTFIPNETRINRDSSLDEDTLTAFAMIRNIQATWPENFDYPKYRALKTSSPAHANLENEDNDSEYFELYIPAHHTTYHHLSDFINPVARDTMQQALDARADLENIQNDLDTLRQQWASGDHSVRDQIIRGENTISAARQRLSNLTNRAISLESTPR